MALLSHIPRVLPDPSTVNSQSSGRVVVALHGTLGEPSTFRLLGRELASRGVDMLAPSYARRGTALIDASAPAITRLIASLPASVTRVDVVGHSLGALVALRALSGPDAAAARARVHTLVGLGAAWRGTGESPWYRPAWLVSRVLGESYVELENYPHEPVVPEGIDVVSVVSDADTEVPAWSSRLGGVITLSGVSHSGLARRTDAVLAPLGLL
ncbi:lipase family alpha/beta hydrolase [Corynebacterium sp. UBA2622]|uniref:lipase family alpha/beta hydrolase n=1 Tax=Corynebacterium sp. UBA2622 TaxID=1946393 RepID=UPI0025B89992|nr:alpha/beta hydrolase [Corynebacterium sp. UBA2622]